MIPNWVIVLVDTVAALTVGAALVMFLWRGRCFTGPARLLFLSITSILLVLAGGNVLEWTGLLPQADLIENFILPLIPTLWLFLFVVELERADRNRLQHGLEQMMAVHNLAADLTVTMESRDIMEQVAEAASRLLDSPFVALLTLDDTADELVVRASRGISPEEAQAMRMPVGVGIGGRAFLDRRYYRSNRPGQALAPSVAPIAVRLGITDIVSVPLLFRDQPVGLLNIGKAHGRTFSDDEITLLETLCAQAAVAIENARLFARATESEARYRVLVENAQIPICVVDANRNITFWNRGAERLFGYTAAEVLGHHIGFIYAPEKRDSVETDILQHLRADGIWFGEYPAIRKDGARFTAFLNLSRIVAADGRVIGTFGAILDVTEHVQLRDQLLQAQKMETVGVLAGGIAHDFNNLLTAILGFSAILRAGAKPGSEELDAVTSIEQAAQRGTQLVRQLLAFSRRQPTNMEILNLNEVIRDATELIERTFPRTVVIMTRLASDLRAIRGDTTQMHQIIMNLAINARDAMASRGELTIMTDNVDLRERDPRGPGLPAGPYVRLTAADTGQGIPPEVMPHIFEPFFTTKPPGGGTGLGLSTVYAIVTRHAGGITCKSLPGQGTVFRILLPAVLNPSESPADAEARPAAETN